MHLFEPVDNYLTKCFKLHAESTIFTAEIHVISHALEYISQSEKFKESIQTSFRVSWLSEWGKDDVINDVKLKLFTIFGFLRQEIHKHCLFFIPFFLP